MEKELQLAETENIALKKKIQDMEDTMIRMEANQRRYRNFYYIVRISESCDDIIMKSWSWSIMIMPRKENMARIQAEIEAEDKKIAEAIREIRVVKWM